MGLNSAIIKNISFMKAYIFKATLLVELFSFLLLTPKSQAQVLPNKISFQLCDMFQEDQKYSNDCIDH